MRHGETVLGAQDRYAGQIDTTLTPRGRRQIAALRARIARLKPDAIYCSSLTRCRQTADLLVPGREITVSRRIREIDFGRWEGLTKAQVVERYGDAYHRWHADPSSGTPHRGESVPDLRRRVRRFAAEVARRHPGKTVLFVTHGGVIRALLDIPFEGYWDVKVPPASLWRVNVGASPQD